MKMGSSMISWQAPSWWSGLVRRFRLPVPGTGAEIHGTLPAAGTVYQPWRADHCAPRGAGKGQSPAHCGNDSGGRLRHDRRGYQQRPPREETEKAAESGPGKKPSIRERLEDAKKECFGTQAAGEGTLRPGYSGAWQPMSRSKKWRREWAFFLGENGRRQYNKICRDVSIPASRVSGRSWWPAPITSPYAQKSVRIRVENGREFRPCPLFQRPPL